VIIIKGISKEELNEILTSNNVVESIKIKYDAIVETIPEIKEMKAFNQNNKYHVYDVLNHTLEVLRNTENDLELRLSALFHDIGKPSTYTIDSKGIGHFYGHGDVSVELTSIILERLNYDKNLITNVLELIRFHDYPIFIEEKPLKKFLKRFDNKLLSKLLNLKRADILGQNPEYRSRLELIDKIEEKIKKTS
jgi:tRNA nucleotidyltransferase (CCA-adding enzyme)